MNLRSKRGHRGQDTEAEVKWRVNKWLVHLDQSLLWISLQYDQYKTFFAHSLTCVAKALVFFGHTNHHTRVMQHIIRKLILNAILICPIVTMSYRGAPFLKKIGVEKSSVTFLTLKIRIKSMTWLCGNALLNLGSRLYDY